MVQQSGNPLTRLEAMGQSVWLDDIRRDLLEDGSLSRLVESDGISGVTSNPAIFERAITSGFYSDAIAGYRRAGLSPVAIYEQLAVRDISRAAEILYPVYEQSDRRDGYVSIEVSPQLADDAAATCNAARRLWSLVERPNLMIKVPATNAGIDAIATLIAEGINVNATLLFSREVYKKVSLAWITGLEEWNSRGGDPSRLASVASFFVSRIDTAVDKLIERALTGSNPKHASRLTSLAGKIAIASARLAYQDYLSVLGSERWQALQRLGAHPQRLLWGSTSTKNPEYRDVRYVEELIGPETVTTVPMPTLAAFRDHGRPRASLIEELDESARLLDRLAQCGISLPSVTSRLVREGVELFSEASAKILVALASTGAQREEAS